MTFQATDCVLDLETMGNTADAPVLQIGAVLLDRNTGTLGAKFNVHIDFASAVEAGAKADASTVLWWIGQGPDARSALLRGQLCADPLPVVLASFRRFLDAAERDSHGIRVWGNGATFDCTILRRSYERAGVECPWAFWNERDLRTALELAGISKDDVPKRHDFIAHDALHDAIRQADLLVAVLNRLKINQK